MLKELDNDDDDFNDGIPWEDEFMSPKANIQKLIDYWEDWFQNLDEEWSSSLEEIYSLTTLKGNMKARNKVIEVEMGLIGETIRVLKAQLPKKHKDCGSCSNNNDNGMLDGDCYMCVKDLENNYEPIKENTKDKITSRIEELESRFTKIEEEI